MENDKIYYKTIKDIPKESELIVHPQLYEGKVIGSFSNDCSYINICFLICLISWITNNLNELAVFKTQFIKIKQQEKTHNKLYSIFTVIKNSGLFYPGNSKPAQKNNSGFGIDDYLPDEVYKNVFVT